MCFRSLPFRLKRYCPELVLGSIVLGRTPNNMAARGTNFVRSWVRHAEEYISAVQLNEQRLGGNQEIAVQICEFLGSDIFERIWVHPYFLTDVSDFVGRSLNGWLLS